MARAVPQGNAEKLQRVASGANCSPDLLVKRQGSASITGRQFGALRGGSQVLEPRVR